jgi:hypothetical protein
LYRKDVVDCASLLFIQEPPRPVEGQVKKVVSTAVVSSHSPLQRLSIRSSNMRTATSVAALALALLQGTDAFNAAKSRNYNLLADMGLNADGSAMGEASTVDSIINSLNLGSLKSVAADGVAARQAAPEVINPEYVNLKLDHFGKSKETFNNRFWVAESGYKPGGPVFIYDVGEANAEPNALFRLQNTTSFFKQIVDQFGGIGIAWEHRFCESNHNAW